MTKRPPERLYVTTSVQKRIDGLTFDMLASGLSVKETASMLNVKVSTLNNYIYSKNYMPLHVYLKCAEVFHWDLSRDVNYMYANRLYSPEELKRRLKRIGIRSYFELSAILDYVKQDQLRSAVNYLREYTYGHTSTVICYGKIVRFIAHEEKLDGYADALDVED